MAKEFDIYLNRRIKECDLIVFSLPFRDGLTATNRMILESCIEAYTLQKFVAIQTGSELVAHIDRMLKTCYEMLHLTATVDVEAAFQTHYSVYPEKNSIEISSQDISTLATMFTEAESAMQIGASSLLANVGKSLGYGKSLMELDMRLQDTLKQSILRWRTGVGLDAQVTETQEINFIAAEAAVVPAAKMTDLCYRITSTVSTAMEIAAFVLGTELHFSFGRAYSGIAIDSSVKGEEIQKFEVVRHTLDILTQLTECVIQFMEPDHMAMELTAAASSIVKRHRLLKEMDADLLSHHDTMTLEDVDFVIL